MPSVIALFAAGPNIPITRFVQASTAITKLNRRRKHRDSNQPSRPLHGANAICGGGALDGKRFPLCGLNVASRLKAPAIPSGGTSTVFARKLCLGVAADFPPDGQQLVLAFPSSAVHHGLTTEKKPPAPSQGAGRIFPHTNPILLQQPDKNTIGDPAELTARFRPTTRELKPHPSSPQGSRIIAGLSDKTA